LQEERAVLFEPLLLIADFGRAVLRALGLREQPLRVLDGRLLGIEGDCDFVSVVADCLELFVALRDLRLVGKDQLAFLL
jgi:hypothetical protein